MPSLNFEPPYENGRIRTKKLYALIEFPFKIRIIKTQKKCNLDEFINSRLSAFLIVIRSKNNVFT